MDLIQEILKQRKLQGFSWNKLAEKLPISGDGLSKAFARKSVDKAYLSHMSEILSINEYRDTEQNLGEKEFEINDQKKLSEKELHRFLEILYLHKEEYENTQLYKTFEEEIRVDERKKFIKEYLTKKLNQ